SLAAAARLAMGIADAGTDMRLHSVVPATILMTSAFTGHLPIVSARPVTSPPTLNWMLSRTPAGGRSRSVGKRRLATCPPNGSPFPPRFSAKGSLLPLQVADLRGSQAVPIGDQDHRRVAMPVAAMLACAVHQPLDLALGEIAPFDCQVLGWRSASY